MNVRPVSQLTLYRYRYVIGYALLAVMVALLLVLNITSLPPGLTAGEQASALSSHSLKLQIDISKPFEGLLAFLQQTNAVDLPYHILQKVSLEVFGLSPLGVRLPSILLAASSAFIVFQLLRRWLIANTAIVMSLIIATSSWFLTIGRLGTPDIMIIFWTALGLLLATLVSQDAKGRQTWKILGLVSAGLSLYTPGMVFLYAAALLATITQPHLRYVLRYTREASVAVGIILLLIALAPLGFTIWKQPDTVWQLLAVSPNLPDPVTFLKNLADGFSQLANPFASNIDIVITPLISLSLLVLALIGLWRLLVDWHSVRSQVLLVWLAMLIPVVGLGMMATLAPLFVPIMLLAAIGMQTLVRYWYKLFPRNPYARIFGLLPIGLLIVSVVQFSYQRYFVALPYGPQTAQVYDQDAFILHDAITSKLYRTQRILLIAPPEMRELYAIDQSSVKNLEIINANQFTAPSTATSIIIAESEFAKFTPAGVAMLPKGQTELLVNDRKENALRFRIFSQ